MKLFSANLQITAYINSRGRVPLPSVHKHFAHNATLPIAATTELGRYYAMHKGLAVSVGIIRVATRVVMAVIRGSAYAVDARTPVISFRH
jgi:hypothetical protein